ncbi:GlsB/YeaQ/YmgE family stress response membrane protein [Luteolibacter marinus]|uniref:GlsB/YeaQ/YmgE family stress response membrane protein n=1 Tax=Luteolibacter marinus TaxID=2776705 RepID=UPI0018670E12|nr:GlsB/YeaQ/YmgE family stress response membrane protein [Luteolibacter marinus]
MNVRPSDLLIGASGLPASGHPRIAELAGWILLGLFAGLIARKIMPGEEKGGCLLTIVLGILGAVVGGWIGRHFGYLQAPEPGEWLPSPDSVITATVGALLVLLIWKWMKK